MEKLKIKLIIFFVITFFSALVLQSCGESTTQPPVSNNADSCGANNFRTRNFDGPLFGGYSPSTYTVGSERYYNFYLTVDSICTDKHITTSFAGRSKDTLGRKLKFEAAVEWQIFWEVKDTGFVNVNSGIRDWQARIENLGLKVPFDENPALVFVNIYVHFPTFGSVLQDSVFLAGSLKGLQINIDYAYHKFPADDNNIITPANHNKMKLFNDNNEKYIMEKEMRNIVTPYRKSEKTIQLNIHK